MVKKLKIDLACGSNKVDKTWTGVDIAALAGVDIVCDLEQYPWPIATDSVDQIFCSHYIEHTKDLFKFIDECYRVCKHKAKVEFIAPYYTHIGAWQDPTHVRAISERTYDYFNELWRIEAKIDHYDIKANFEIVAMNPKLEKLAPDGRNWDDVSEPERDFYAKHFWNVIRELHVVLECIK